LPPTGIVPVNPPFPSSTYVVDELGWQLIRNGKRVAVYAGASAADHAQGVVIVEVAALRKAYPEPSGELVGDGGRRLEVYSPPKRSGALEISHADRSLLTLRAESGAMFVFDVEQRTWVPGS
jgi:hypothetical protein